LLGSTVTLLLAGVVWLPVAGAAAPTSGYIVVLKGSVGSPAGMAAEQAQARSLRVGHVYRTR
jgi:hypothetical protein